MENKEEIWKDIEGYEGHYQVSNLGRIKTLGGKTWKSVRIMNTEIDVGGYERVSFSKKHYKVHRLVAQAFIPNPDNLPQINHKDENKLNNCVDNLEWCNEKYNINYGTCKQRQSENQSQKILCIETGEIFNSVRECKEKGYIHCNDVCNGKRSVCCGYHFKWIDEPNKTRRRPRN